MKNAVLDVGVNYSTFLKVIDQNQSQVLRTNLLWGGTALSSFIAIPMSIFTGAPPVVIDAVGVATGLLGNEAIKGTIFLKEQFNALKKAEVKKFV